MRRDNDIRRHRELKVEPTPVLHDDFLNCFLKLECKNPSGSHKDRETLYLVNKFGWDKQYIVTSSGNAGISLAYWMKDNATVLVPEITPQEKTRLIRKHGGNVIIKGKEYPESYNFVEQIAKEKGLLNVSAGFVERWRGDVELSYELKPFNFEWIFVPAANHSLAYGIAFGFQEMIDQDIIDKPPQIVSCVVPDHPFAQLNKEMDARFQKEFNSIYIGAKGSGNIKKEFLNFTFSKVKSTRELDSVLKLTKQYPAYDPVVLLAMYISKRYSGKKAVMVTGGRR